MAWTLDARVWVVVGRAGSCRVLLSSQSAGPAWCAVDVCPLWMCAASGRWTLCPLLLWPCAWREDGGMLQGRKGFKLKARPARNQTRVPALARRADGLSHPDQTRTRDAVSPGSPRIDTGRSNPTDGINSQRRHCTTVKPEHTNSDSDGDRTQHTQHRSTERTSG